MTTTSPISTQVEKLQDKNTKDLLKSFNKLLTQKETKSLIANNEPLSQLAQQLTTFTDALKDTYSPNILRFMTSRDAYIKELVASAEHIQNDVIPAATQMAQSLEINADQKPFIQTLLAYLRVFQTKNIAIQAKVDNCKGDMIENTTHDIMQKHLKKNFLDIGELATPIINALQEKLQ